MPISVFDYSNYKSYLTRNLEYLGKIERGWKLKTANFIGCQPSYLSQILNGKPNLTLEQAHKISRLFLHDKIETRYFILLVEQARAATKDLRDYFGEQMSEIRTSRFDLKKRLKETEEIPDSVKHKYYSAWFYSAIHIALAVPTLQNSKAIATQFHLPEELVVSTIKFLEECELIENKGGTYQFTKKRIHLGRESDFIRRHHINWRSQALQSTEKNLDRDLHFSTVFAISKSDFDGIKEVLVQTIESARAIIKPSKSEEVCAITLDFFGL